MRHDLAYALRQMRRKPMFAVIVILTLTLGLGASTAVFSELYAVVLNPLPYRAPDQLVAVHNRFAQLPLERLGTSPFDYVDLREHRELFSDVGLYYFLDLNHTGVEGERRGDDIQLVSDFGCEAADRARVHWGRRTLQWTARRPIERAVLAKRVRGRPANSAALAAAQRRRISDRWRDAAMVPVSE
jgi:hypothetical protein